jgi:hypothetical protein
MKKTKSPQLLRTAGLFSLAALLVFQFVGALLTKPAYADPIAPRVLELVAGATDGGSKPGGVVNHKFTFTLPAGGSVGSIKFEYCTTAADVGAATCVAPNGINAGSATLASEAGSGITGMTMHAATGPNYNSYYLSRGSAFTMSSATAVTYTIGDITNPTPLTGLNMTFFVRITAYTSLDTTGAVLDKGTVAASVNAQIVLDGTMPESLVFCTGAAVFTTASVPDCSTVTTGTISFTSLFSPTATASATSQMAASTNAGSGYVITANGATLTSGSNTISPMNTAGVSNHGNSQFGLNLTTNTVDTVPTGVILTPASNTTNYRGQPLTDYGTSDTYKFLSGDPIANSGNAVLGGTDAQIYTVTYIANVPGSLPAGNYSTTLTYICTPTY